MSKEILTQKDYKISDGVKAVWKLSRPHRKTMGVLAVLGVVSAAANAATPYLSGRFFDALTGVTGKGVDVSLLPVLWTLGAWFFVQVMSTVVVWGQSFLSRSLPEDIEISIHKRNTAHLLRLPISFFKQHRNSEIHEICNRGTGRTVGIITDSLSIFPDLLSVVFGIAFAFFLNARLAGILLSGAFVYIVIMLRSVRRSAELNRAAVAGYNKAYGRSYGAIGQVDVVKISTAEDNEDKELNKEISAARGVWKKLEMMWARLDGFQRTIFFVVQSSIFLISIELVAKGDISIGTLVAFNGYGMMFLTPIIRIGLSWMRFQTGFVAAALMYQTVLDHPTEIYHPENAKPLGKMRGEVEFENVSFRYSDGDTNILNSVSFIAHPGETVALVGESGVGKSTTISLISALYFPTSGSIKIDGKDTRTLDLTELRGHIAVVPQELSLFNDTIEANIKYGTFNATLEEIVAAAEVAQADGFIGKFPNGYETLVGERGVKLSVGQKQRVAIARAVLRDPAILILDEPTSALDPRTEKELSASLEKLMEGRTTFIVAHRLSTVRKADKIIVIEEGRMAESGSHDELMRIDGGKYRAMYEHHIGLHE